MLSNRRVFLKQAGAGAVSLGFLTNLPGCQSSEQPLQASTDLSLPRSTPEEQGISSSGIRTFLQAVKESNVAITSESFDMQASMNLVWDHLLPAMEDTTALPADSNAQAQFKQDLDNLIWEPPKMNPQSPTADRISGKTFTLGENDFQAKTITFNFSGDRRSDLPTAIAASATWQDDNTLVMTWRFIETAHSDQITCVFAEDQVTVQMLNSVAKGRNESDGRPALHGTVA